MTTNESTPGREKRYCGGKKRQGEGTCTRPAGWGTDHVGTGCCKLHGGATPSHGKRAILVVAQQQAREWGARLDVTPPQALYGLVQAKAGEVVYWNHRVAQLPEDERAGMLLVKTTQGDGPHGPTDSEVKQAGTHVFLQELHRAEDQLADFSAASIRAGLDEALVRMAVVQAPEVIGLCERVAEAARRDLCRALGVSPERMAGAPVTPIADLILEQTSGGW